jgi:hypothetical protein
VEKLVLTITYDESNPQGALHVSGCIEAEPMAIWMLEKAKDAIKVHNMQKAAQGAPRILKPTFIPNLNGGRPQ